MFIFLAAAVVVAAIAAVHDFRTGLIPNWLTLGTLVFAVVAHGAHGLQRGGAAGALLEILGALGGVAVCGLVPAVMFRLGAMGGGDVKLFAAIGALCHVHYGLEAQTYSFVVAVLVAPVKLAYEGKLFRTLASSLALIVNPFRRKETRKAIPAEMMTWFRLAPAICAGTFVMALIRGSGP